MKDTIFLIVSPYGVQGMRKSLVDVKRGEVMAKVVIEIDNDAFTPPVIEQYVHIESPYKGIDLSDVHFKGDTITEEEAAIIRKRRLEKAAEILRANNYQVTEPEDPADE